MRISGYEVTVDTQAAVVMGLGTAVHLIFYGVGRLALHFELWSYEGVSPSYGAFQHAWIAVVGAIYVLISLVTVTGLVVFLSFLFEIEEVSDDAQ
jgi:hypothetical protein